MKGYNVQVQSLKYFTFYTLHVRIINEFYLQNERKEDFNDEQTILFINHFMNFVTSSNHYTTNATL